MKFSLIIPTLNRTTELFRLLETLKNQTFKSFELIIVDQNENNYINDINFKEKYSLERVTVVKPNSLLCASAARNFGAKYAIGEIISFPDDDCWYEENILENVSLLYKNTGADIISGASIDPTNKKSNTVFLESSKFITKSKEVPQAGIEYSVFIQRSIFDVLKFDENISPGSKGIYQAGEVTDLLFFAFEAQKKIFYSSSLIIYHPFKEEGIRNFKKEFYYGNGFGYVLRKHNHYSLWFYFLFRTFGGAINSVFSLKFEDFLIRIVRLIGRFWGFVKPLKYEV